MVTLYYMPGACSLAVHVILNELGEKAELVNVSVPAGQPRSPEFLKINPRGNVPVLVDGDVVIREGGAIISYLLDKHNSPMLPKISENGGKNRAKALEWLMFANATLHPTYGRAFFALKNITDEAAAQDQVLKLTIEQINKHWADVNNELATKEYICGNAISGADILLSVIANWGQNFPYKIVLGDNVKRMLKNVTARPAYQKALKDEQVEYKAAA